MRDGGRKAMHERRVPVIGFPRGAQGSAVWYVADRGRQHRMRYLHAALQDGGGLRGVEQRAFAFGETHRLAHGRRRARSASTPECYAKPAAWSLSIISLHAHSWIREASWSVNEYTRSSLTGASPYQRCVFATRSASIGIGSSRAVARTGADWIVLFGANTCYWDGRRRVLCLDLRRRVHFQSRLQARSLQLQARGLQVPLGGCSRGAKSAEQRQRPHLRTHSHDSLPDIRLLDIILDDEPLDRRSHRLRGPVALALNVVMGQRGVLASAFNTHALLPDARSFVAPSANGDVTRPSADESHDGARRREGPHADNRTKQSAPRR
jgi:hypothetical protein